MPRATPIQSNFNGGEVSPLLSGRTDLAAYGISVGEMLNIIPTIQGGALKRSGSRFVNQAKTAGGAVRLIGFEPQLTQAYLIEATDQAFRFYTNNGILLSGGAPLVLATPFLSAELAALSYEPSNDVMYFAHGAHQQQIMSRTGASSFTMAPLALVNGPFKDGNTDQTVTVSSSGTSGVVTLFASAPIFKPGHVGALFQIQAKDFSDTLVWEPGYHPISVGDKRRSEGKVYVAAAVSSTNGSAGSVQPTHTEGSAWDGTGSAQQDINSKPAGGILWSFLYDQFGTVQITAVAGGGLSCTATVVRRLADSVVTVPTWRWSHALFSAEEGWPNAVCIWNERLVFAKGTTIVGSVVGDLTNFAERDVTGLLTADMAFRFTLSGPNPVQWMRADRQLIVGTTKGEFAIGPLNANAAAGPGNLQGPPQSFHGSIAAQPVQVGSKTLFVQRAGRKIREAGYDFQVDRYVANDTTVRAEHITRSGVTQLAYQQEPFSLIWAVRADGVLLSFTYSEEQDVRGWSRHILGGTSDAAGTATIVESVACIPDPSGQSDQLWLSVKRWINGQQVRYIERLETFWDFGQNKKDGFFVDGGLTYMGAPAATISGLNHLAGETVWVLADGASHPDRVVSAGGQITLANDLTASTIQIGLAYTARLTTLNLEAGSADGTAQSKTKKVIKLALRLLEALALRVGPPSGNQDDILLRRPSDPMDQGPALFTGDEVMDYPGDFERDGRITVESYQPLPFALLALMPRVDTRG